MGETSVRTKSYCFNPEHASALLVAEDAVRVALAAESGGTYRGRDRAARCPPHSTENACPSAGARRTACHRARQPGAEIVVGLPLLRRQIGEDRNRIIGLGRRSPSRSACRRAGCGGRRTDSGARRCRCGGRARHRGLLRLSVVSIACGTDVVSPANTSVAAAQQSTASASRWLGHEQLHLLVAEQVMRDGERVRDHPVRATPVMTSRCGRSCISLLTARVAEPKRCLDDEMKLTSTTTALKARKQPHLEALDEREAAQLRALGAPTPDRSSA